MQEKGPAGSVPGKKVSLKVLFCYGVGHFLNDMTAACWFNYLLVFLIQVTNHSPSHAGIVILSGQVADAIATPLVGYVSDRTSSRFGRRKLWLVLGAILVNISFFFVFGQCYPCHEFAEKWPHDSSALDVVYYCVLASAFNVGWAAVQVSHMSLVPELTTDDGERVRLNSARYAGGIAAILGVLGISWIAFQLYGISADAFYIISVSSMVIGNFFTIIFLWGVPEPIIKPLDDGQIQHGSRLYHYTKPDWRSWFKVPRFYQVALVYMCARIAGNISQVLMPFYLQFYLNLQQTHRTVIAEVPLVLMVTSFLVSFCMKKLDKNFGRKSSFLIGTLFNVAGLVIIFFLPVNLWYLVFGAAFLLGLGTTISLITATSMQSDVVGMRSDGAFVYGFHSFADKLSNGLLVEFTSPYSKDGTITKNLVALIPAIASVAGLLITFTIREYYRKPQKYPKTLVDPQEVQPFISSERTEENDPANKLTVVHVEYATHSN